jgi:Ras family
MESTD